MTTKKKRFNKMDDVIEKTSQDGNDPFDYLEKTNVRQVMTKKKENEPQPKNMAEALLEFQKLAVSASKDSKNPHFKSSYASLEAVISAANEATQFGICFTQEIDFEFNGDTGMTFVRTVLIHAPSGEQRTSRTPIRSKDPADPQKMGSGITYAKRYGLQSALGLPSEDDDGNDASKAPKGKVQHINPDDERTW